MLWNVQSLREGDVSTHSVMTCKYGGCGDRRSTGYTVGSVAGSCIPKSRGLEKTS